MEKDFISRAKKKSEIEDSQRTIIVKKRQIWVAYIGVNIGNESSKNSPYVRPCLIINPKFYGDLVLVGFLTTKYNENLANTYVKIPKNISGLNEDSYLMLNQIKPISKKRLIRKLNDNSKIGLLDNKPFIAIINSVKKFI
ncbi:MAG: hypothetical protein CR971_00990 [candidate division SR1 bacterium]|nr:MAG: hypothetical protein CR971_00990 [candidate division SR1 bacterium]